MDDECLSIYLEESRDHLADIENDLLLMESSGSEIDLELVNKIFRAAHSIKGGAGLLGLQTIKELSHWIESVLDMIRKYELIPAHEVVSVLLKAFDFLRELVENIAQSEEVDISLHVEALTRIVSGEGLESDAAAGTEPEMEVSLSAEENDLSFYQEDEQDSEPGRVMEDEPQHDPDLFDIPVSDEGSDQAASDPDMEGHGQIQSHMQEHPTGSEDSAQFQEGEAVEAAPEDVTATSASEKLEVQAEQTSVHDEGRQHESAPSVPDSLRVHVNLLENLMNLAGELVISRNQLMQAVSSRDDDSLNLAGQRIDMVTSELQEAIMLTRMQPLANIFNKFPRVIRDIARDQGKEINLKIEGQEVELDKTIIEGIASPLSQLLNNAAVHGIETPKQRSDQGKKTDGQIILRAYHAAGQVNIEVIDNGRGIPVDRIVDRAVHQELVTREQVSAMSAKEKAGLIFLPGLFAQGRESESSHGTGMSMVKANLDRLGGQASVETQENQGTTIRMKLPLTLAIIPSLLISAGNEIFAVPQINIHELIKISADLVSDRIKLVGGASVLLLRGELVPLVDLAEALGMKQDSAASDSAGNKPEDMNIIIVSAGLFQFGIIVEGLHDSQEIVVKPLGRHISECEGFAGATIMGNGKVALILDIAGLGKLAGLSSLAGSENGAELNGVKPIISGSEGRQTLFMFNNGPREFCALPLDLVSRVEIINAEDIETAGGKRVIQYRGGNLPVFTLEDVCRVESLEIEGQLVVIVFYMAGREVGLLAHEPLDVMEADLTIDDFTLKQQGIAGSLVLNSRTTLIVDIYEFMETLNPHWFENREEEKSEALGSARILLVEDSDFFRSQVRKFIEDEGFNVALAAEDGQIAWDYLNDNPNEIRLVVTDLEMPVMDGFELTQLIKNDDRFRHLPVLALTSLAGPEDVARGRDSGIDDYQIKLDKDKLMKSIHSFMKSKAA